MIGRRGVEVWNLAREKVERRANVGIERRQRGRRMEWRREWMRGRRRELNGDGDGMRRSWVGRTCLGGEKSDGGVSEKGG